MLIRLRTYTQACLRTEAEETIMTAVITIYRRDGTLGLGPLCVDLNGIKINKLMGWNARKGRQRRRTYGGNGGGFSGKINTSGKRVSSSG